MAQMVCVGVPDRAVLSLLEFECTRWRSALTQPVMVFLDMSEALFFEYEMKRSLYSSLKGLILAS